jgi:broad specificity phosphatase PhoE
MNLYFIRHGETDFNKEHRLQGVQFDEPLNADGIAAMNDLVKVLPTDFEVIYASSLKRVMMSAEIISKAVHKPIIVNDDLIEKSVGSLAGKTWDEIPNSDDLHKKDSLLEYDYRPFGGESVDDVKERFSHFIEAAKRSNKSALVVTSIGVIRIAYRILLGKEGKIEVKNASVHTFQI